MGTEAALIPELETALRRLLDPATPRNEKQQLEQHLTRFKAATTVCLPVVCTLLTTSQNEYALWFAATTLEEYVAKHWLQFPPSEQVRIRQFVWDYLVAATPAPGAAHIAFARRKLRKVLADIAKIQWRGAEQGDARWPEFMHQLEALIVSDRTRATGLELLSVVVEEFGRDDAMVLATIKQHAKTRLIAQRPTILGWLAQTLEECRHLLETSQVHEAVQHQDGVARVALLTLHHFMTYAPVADQMNDAWITLLLTLARREERVAATSGQTHTGDASVAALQCLAELMSKRCMGTHGDDRVKLVMQGLCALLQETVEDCSGRRATALYLDKLSDCIEAFSRHQVQRLENPVYGDMVPTFLHLIHVVTTKQLHVEGLFNWLKIWDVFVSYLEERPLLDSVPTERVRNVVTMYETSLVTVMLHLVERVRYESNQTQLNELEDGQDAGTLGDYEESDDPVTFELERSNGNNGQDSLQDLAQASTNAATGTHVDETASRTELSERKQFIVDCIALIRRIAALATCAPVLFNITLPRVQRGAEQVLFHIHQAPAVPQRAEHGALRDLTVDCALLSCGWTSSYSQSDDGKQQLAGWQILPLFITMAEYIVHHHLHTRGKQAFVALQCEVLTSLRCCLSCIPYVIQSGAKQDVLKACESVLQVLLQTLDTRIVPSPVPVMQNSMQLLANLGFVLPYDDLMQIPSMSQLETHIHDFSLHLPLAIQGDLYMSMSNSIVNAAVSLCGSSRTLHGLNPWQSAYGLLLGPLRESIEKAAMALHQNEQRVLEHAMVAQHRRDCHVVRCLARSVETKPKRIKEAFYSVFQTSFPSILRLLTLYFTAMCKLATSSAPQSRPQIKSALQVVNEIVRLYAQLLKSIRKEMQKDTVAEIMRTFVDIFNDSQLSGVLLNQEKAGLMVLCGFLQLLRIVVEEPTSVFDSFLPNILDLCFGPLKEVIFTHRESDTVILCYYVALVEQLLETHFRFFIVSSGQFSPDGARERKYATHPTHAYFLSVFQSLASILSREGSNLAPRLCKQVLGVLDRVDQAQQLFAFTGFQSELRMGFLSTLMNILTRGEMNLLQDDVIQVLHRVAAVDFASFYQVFLSTYIKEILTQPQLEAASKLEGKCLQWSGQVDLPTFSQELIAFLNDLRVIKAQN